MPGIKNNVTTLENVTGSNVDDNLTKLMELSIWTDIQKKMRIRSLCSRC